MSDPQLATSAPVPRRGVAVAALVVGIASLVLCLVPWVGLGLGVVGLVLGIVALRTRARKGKGIAGLVLSIIGMGVGVLVLLFVYLALPAIGSFIAHGGYDDNAGENSRYDENYDFSKDYLVDTPCYSFTGPSSWINHQNPYYTADCLTNLEDHGGLDDSGRYVFDSTQYGRVSVAVDHDTTESSTSTGDLTLDGVQATVLSSVEGEWTTDTIAVTMPETKKNYYGEFDALIIYIHVPTAHADATLEQLVDSWKWK